MNNRHEYDTIRPIKGQVASQLFTRKLNKEKKQATLP